MSVAVVYGAKTCASCGLRKELDAFTRDASRPDGRYPRCKTCRGIEVAEPVLDDWWLSAVVLPTVAETDALWFACSTCDAPAGELCEVTRDGQEGGLHLRRIAELMRRRSLRLLDRDAMRLEARWAEPSSITDEEYAGCMRVRCVRCGAPSWRPCAASHRERVELGLPHGAVHAVRVRDWREASQ